LQPKHAQWALKPAEHMPKLPAHQSDIIPRYKFEQLLEGFVHHKSDLGVMQVAVFI